MIQTSTMARLQTLSYHDLKSFSKEQLIAESKRFLFDQEEIEKSLLDQASELAALNEQLQIQYERQSEMQEEIKKINQKIHKLEDKIVQELKDKDIIVRDINQLHAKKEKLVKQVRADFTQKVLGSTPTKDQKKKKEKHKVNQLFQHGEDAFKELMKSSYSHTKNEEEKDEFELSGVKYDPLFK